MDSTRGERSISSGISLPQWMKMKITERYDLEQTAFSPPTEDDGFFFMRYPSKAENLLNAAPEKNTNTINQVRRKISETKPINEAELNLNQHTVPCRQFIAHKYTEPPIQVLKSGPTIHFKSAGTDDGFKTAACGKSVVEVAHQMINNKLYTGRNSQDEFCSPSKSHLKQRRNSKSLPASPITSPKNSPKLARKNPFFTDSSIDSGLSLGGKSAVGRPSGWLFSFLSQRESFEDSLPASRSASNMGSTNSVIDSVESTPNSPNIGNTSPKILRAKPSELREMNFWSPTSM